MTTFGTNNSDLYTLSTDDVHFALGGNDFGWGDASNEEIYGGDGNDGLMGADWLTQTGAGTALDPYIYTSFVVSGNDHLYGDDGSDLLYGGDGNDFLFGGAGDETGAVTTVDANFLKAGLWGGTGNDFIYGEAGNDELFGEADNDFLDGGTGNDSLDGGLGSDTMYGGTGNDSAFGGDGNDTIYGGSGNDFLDGQNQNDTIRGDAGADTILGNAGLDTLYGGTEVDRLIGGADADKLFGDAGNDSLIGDDGADTLTGGVGADVLRGGLGADKFHFASTSERGDIIRDFASDDFLTFKKSAFGNLTLGTLSSAAYRENTTGLAGDSSDRFIYELDTGELYYDSNGNAAGGSVLIATLDNKFNISQADISIV